MSRPLIALGVMLSSLVTAGELSTPVEMILPTNAFLRILPPVESLPTLERLTRKVFDKILHQRVVGNIDVPLWLDLSGYATTKHKTIFVPLEFAFRTNRNVTNFTAKLDNLQLARVYEESFAKAGLTFFPLSSTALLAVPESDADVLRFALADKRMGIGVIPYAGENPLSADIPFQVGEIFVLSAKERGSSWRSIFEESPEALIAALIAIIIGVVAFLIYRRRVANRTALELSNTLP